MPALPPQTRGFRTSRTLRLASVLGSYALAHASLIRSSAFSPDGARLFSGGWDGFLRSWDARTGEEIWAAPTDGAVEAVVVTPEGDVLAATGAGAVGLWDGKTGKPRWSARAHEGGATALALAADGRRAVSGGDDGRLVVWDVPSGKRVRVLGSETLRPDWVWISADGRLGFFGVSEVREHGPVPHLWDLDTGKEASDAQYASAEKALFDAEAYRLNVVGLPGAEGAGSRLVRTVAPGLSLSRDRSRVALAPGGEGSRLEVWDVREGRRLAAAHGQSDRVLAVDVSPDGRWLLSVGSDGSAFVRDASGGAVRWSHQGEEGGVAAAAFADEGRAVVTVEGINAYSTSWVDAATGRELAASDVHATALGGRIMALSPGGRLAAVSERDGNQLAVRRVARRGVIWRFDPRENVLALSADGKLLTERDGTVELVGSHGALLSTFPADATGRPVAAAISPGGDRVATAHGDGTIRVWDALAAREIDRIDLATSTDRPTALWLGAQGSLIVGTARGVVLRFVPLPARRGSDDR